jgi:hypothetical protein
MHTADVAAGTTIIVPITCCSVERRESPCQSCYAQPQTLTVTPSLASRLIADARCIGPGNDMPWQARPGVHAQLCDAAQAAAWPDRDHCGTPSSESDQSQVRGFRWHGRCDGSGLMIFSELLSARACGAQVYIPTLVAPDSRPCGLHRAGLHCSGAAWCKSPG